MVVVLKVVVSDNSLIVREVIECMKNLIFLVKWNKLGSGKTKTTNYLENQLLNFTAI